MSEVTLHIGDRNYTVACAQGEETQVVKLAAMVDQKLKQLGNNLSASPAQNMLFAALLLADELQDTAEGPPSAAIEGQLNELKLELDAIRTERDEALRELAVLRSTADRQEKAPSNALVAELLDRLAEDLEKRAEVLEAKAAAS